MDTFDTRMKQSSNKRSGNQSHTNYITYIYKILSCTEPKYQKNRDIATSTICPNLDPNINISYWKFI